MQALLFREVIFVDDPTSNTQRTEAAAENKSEKNYWFLIIAAVIIIFMLPVFGGAYQYWTAEDKTAMDGTAEDKTAEPSLDKGLTKQAAYNGQMFVVPSYERVCPLTVSVRGDRGYYVYLEYLHAPAYSAEGRHSLSPGYTSPESDLAFYVSPNSSVECSVPIGVYRLYYATGDTWYGPHDKFGNETMYFSSDDLLDFYADSEYYNGTTLELWLQRDGNFKTENIDAADFPS